jgi:hypothetical protein
LSTVIPRAQQQEIADILEDDTHVISNALLSLHVALLVPDPTPARSIEDVALG